MVADMHWATPQERRSLGQTRRKQVGRQEHDELNFKARRAPALTLLERAERGRLAPLLKLKHKLMADSPFVFFRGAAPVMAADLSLVPNTGIVAQLCGDAHVRNLGAFAAPDGRLVFDINDFDETIRGPFEWDLKRMAASLVLAGRESGHKETSARDATEEFVLHYCEKMRTFAEMPLLDVGRYQVHRMASVEPVHDALLKAERATPLHTLELLTEPASNKHGGPADRSSSGGRKPDAPRRFKDIEPNLKRLTGSQAVKVLAALGPYRQMLEPQRQHLLSLYRPVDVAFKIVGTGSIGLRDYCIYLEGNGPHDPLFLQMKEEAPSVYTAYLPDARPAHHNGQRAVEGQRAMQVQSDPFLGWTQMAGRDYLVRQLNDHKGSIELEDLAGSGLAAFAEICGELLARGHARSGDPQVIAGYIGSGNGFATAISKFGSLYADQTEKDWEELCRSRRVKSSAKAKPPGKAKGAARA